MTDRNQDRPADPFMTALKSAFGSTLGKLAASALGGVVIAGGLALWLEVSFMTALIILAVLLVVFWVGSFFMDW